MNENEVNDQLVGVVGYSATGKTAACRNLENQERWVLLNSESGKRPPFKNKFIHHRIVDPYQVHEAFDHYTNNSAVNGVILDSFTFLMDMFESMYIRTTENTMRAWGDYADFIRILMLEKVPKFAKPVVIVAHVKDQLDEKAMEVKSFVPVKGSTGDRGFEAFFSTIVGAKRMTLKELEPYKSELLNITEEEREIGFKYVFQTRVTAKTTGERIRSPMGLFSKEQTFIDNDVQKLLDHLHNYYS